MLLELTERRGADTVGRAVGRLDLRVPLFQLLKLAEEPVIFGVADLRLVQHVVQVVVLFKLLPQFGGPLHGVHRAEDTAWALDVSSKG
jgi:hypothetical protein